MELLPVVALAVVLALVTLVLCDLAGSIARGRGRSYWLFFALGLLLWFPALIAVLRLPTDGPVTAPEPGRAASIIGIVLLAAAAVTGIAGMVAALAFAP